MISSSSRAGSRPAWRNASLDRGQEMSIAQLHRRDVDRHGEPPALLPPEPCLPARLAQHPRPKWTDQAVGLGQRDELVWQHQPALGVVPADQRLDTGEAAAAKIELRLVVQYELAALQRQAQLTLQPSTRRACASIAGSKKANRFRPCALAR